MVSEFTIKLKLYFLEDLVSDCKINLDPELTPKKAREILESIQGWLDGKVISKVVSDFLDEWIGVFQHGFGDVEYEANGAVRYDKVTFQVATVLEEGWARCDCSLSSYGVVDVPPSGKDTELMASIKSSMPDIQSLVDEAGDEAEENGEEEE